MSATKVRNLAIATALVVGGAFFAVRGRNAGPEIPAPGPAIPGLKTNLNNVATVNILKSSGSVALARSGSGAESQWVVPAKGGYPADVDRVRNLLIQLANLELADPQTANPENYAKLGVQDVAPDGKSGKAEGESKATAPTSALVEVKDASGKTLGSIIIGNASNMGSATLDRPLESGQFVRRPGSPQSWLSRGTIYVDAEPMNWVDRKIVGIARDRVKSVSIRRSASGPASPEGHGEPDLFISRADKQAPAFESAALPPDAKLKPNEALDGAVQTIAYLGMDDVIKDPGGVIGGADSGAGPDGAHPATATIETFDGLVVTIKTGFRDGKWWAQVAADAAADALQPEAKPDGPAPTDPKKEAAELNKKLGGWLYAISQFDAKRLSSSLKDMIAPPEVEHAPPAIGPATPGAGPAPDHGSNLSPDQGTPLPARPQQPDFPAPTPK
ncbi:MAG: DUF4340 domain-containing protein [Planctomycetes bacterium]|nr:DUF4340 domain-containing protein [Planctomycetota bacterium]